MCQDHARLKHGHCHKLCSLEAKAAAAQTCSMGVCVAESVDAQSYPSPSLRTLNTDTRDHTARFPATKETSETLCSRDAACADAQLCRHITVVTGRLWHSAAPTPESSLRGHRSQNRVGSDVGSATAVKTAWARTSPHLQRCDRGVDGPGAGDDGPPAAGEGGTCCLRTSCRAS